VQERFPLLREPNEDLAVILFCRRAFHYAVFGQPVNKFHGAVMANQHPRGEFANGGLHAVGQALDGQQELVLLRLDPAGTRLVFAEAQKAADLKAELCQRLKLAN
jgi:hypothetical protein